MRCLRCFGVALVAVFWCALNPTAIGQTDCLIYAEGFDSFAGPRDLDDGTYRVQWCDNNATVTTSSFCPTGNAFKLDSSGDDPVIFAASATGACTSYTIEFQYSQFVNTGTVLRFVTTNDSDINCAQSVTTGAVALLATNGVCTTVTHTVPVAAGQSVYWSFDHGNNTNAIFIDNVTVQVSGCCDAGVVHGCCETGAAGCDDSVVEQCVCLVDPFCCDTQWDQFCVDQVESLACGSCAPAASCIGDFFIDFGTAFQSGSVCSLFPQLFDNCEGIGPFISSSSACGGSGDMVMTFASGFPYSAATTTCIDMTAAAQATLSFDYTKNTGTLGPRVEISTDGITFNAIWTAPIVFTGNCEPVSLDLSSFGGESQVRLRFSSGSSVSNGAAFDNISMQTGDTATHDCCEVGDAGCADAAIQTCVCVIDPFCCDTEWDDLCVIGVEFYQCGDCGLCVEDYAVDFGNTFTGGNVCDLFPELFVLCEGSGPWITTGTDCGGAGDPAMLFGVGGAETSAAYTRCLNIAALTEAALQFRYTKIDATTGPIVDISLDGGGTFGELWRADSSPGAGCHEVCVDLSPFAGLAYVILRFRAGDSGTAGSAIDDIVLVRGSSCPPTAQSPDIDGSGMVDVFDLLDLLQQWGACGKASPCTADIDNSGVVDVFDLLTVLNAWGTSPGN